MPARFRIYDDGGKCADRYFIIDSKPELTAAGGLRYFTGFGFSAAPYHPQGIGQHIEIPAGAYFRNAYARFRNWGTRIAGNSLNKDCRRAVTQFMKDRGASEASIHTAMTLHQKETA